jgi:hypothetical protein
MPSWRRTSRTSRARSVSGREAAGRQDACRATPYADTPSLLRDLKSAPRRELVSFDGGDPPQSGPCEARSAHGDVSLEAEVVAAIVRWITASR